MPFIHFIDTCSNLKCLHIKECEPFTNLLKQLKKPLKPSIVDFLQNQQCGFEEDYPKVCCSNLPKNLPIFTHSKQLHFIEPSTSTPKIDLFEKGEAINKAFASDFYDLDFWDIFRRKRGSKNDFIASIEIR